MNCAKQQSLPRTPQARWVAPGGRGAQIGGRTTDWRRGPFSQWCVLTSLDRDLQRCLTRRRSRSQHQRTLLVTDDEPLKTGSVADHLVDIRVLRTFTLLAGAGEYEDLQALRRWHDPEPGMRSISAAAAKKQTNAVEIKFSQQTLLETSGSSTDEHDLGNHFACPTVSIRLDSVKNIGQ